MHVMAISCGSSLNTQAARVTCRFGDTLLDLLTVFFKTVPCRQFIVDC